MRARAPFVSIRVQYKARPWLLFLGAIGTFALFLSAVSPLDDMVQPEYAQKTWCNGSPVSGMEQARPASHQHSGFLPQRVHEPALAASASECPLPTTVSVRTVVVASDDGRGPPLLFHST